MKRRNFVQTVVAGAAAIHMVPFSLKGQGRGPASVRLGGPLFESYEDPDEWIGLLKSLGYRAAYCPVKPDAEESLIQAYETAARKHDVVISEVGAWSNPISLDREEAEKAFEKCVKGLQLADQIGASCCVNVSGSRNPEYWAGPHKDNLTRGLRSGGGDYPEDHRRGETHSLLFCPGGHALGISRFHRYLSAIDRGHKPTPIWGASGSG